MTVKNFFQKFVGRSEPHVIIDEEGEPLGVLLSYDRYDALTKNDHTHTYETKMEDREPIMESNVTPNAGPVHVVPMQKTEPAPFRWDAAVEESNEPHFQFEPIEEEGDLTA